MYGNERCESGVLIESLSDSNTEFTNDFIKTISLDTQRPRSSGKVMLAYRQEQLFRSDLGLSRSLSRIAVLRGGRKEAAPRLPLRERLRLGHAAHTIRPSPRHWAILASSIDVVGQ